VYSIISADKISCTLSLSVGECYTWCIGPIEMLFWFLGREDAVYDVPFLAERDAVPDVLFQALINAVHGNCSLEREVPYMTSHSSL